MQTQKPICLLDSTIVLSRQHSETLSEFVDIQPYHSDEPDSALLQKSTAILLHSRLPAERLNELINCKYIGIRAHNLDYIDTNSARNMGIEVRGIPPVGRIAVAEHTVALIFAVAKRLIVLHENTVSGKWRSGLSPNFDLYQKYLGVIGYGAIGQRVAELGRAIGMKVVVCPSRHKTENSMALKDVLSLSDVVTLHIPYNPENYHFINAERISMMKEGAILINTARGGVLDYQALEAALGKGKISGAGLDVFEKEPPPVPGALLNLPNVICTPHVAFFSEETLFELNSHLVENALRFFRNL